MTISPAPAQLSEKFQRAFALHRRGELPQAQSVYEEILRAQPRHFDALHLLGVIAGQTNNYDRALDLLGRAVAVEPNNAAAHGNRGFALKRLGQWEAALASYDRAIALNPDYADALYSRGDVLRELGQREAALASFDRAIALRANHAEAYVNRGMVFNDLKRWNDALASFDQAIAIKADLAEAHYNRGNVLKALGQLGAALLSYDRAVAVNSGYVEAYVNRGIVLDDLKRWDAALDSFDRAIAIKVDCAEAYSNRGNVLEQQGQWDAALASYDQAIAIRSDYAEAYSNRGVVLERLKRWDAALSSYDRAIAITPDVAEPYLNRGVVLCDLKQWDAALASYDKAISLKADYPEAYSNRGAALKELKRWDAALTAYNQAIALKSDYAEAYVNRGTLLKELRQWEAALADFDRAIAIDPDLAEAYSNRGDVLRELRQYPAAIASFDRAIALKPHSTAVAGVRLYTRMQICDWSGVEDETARLMDRIQYQTAVENPLCVMALSGSPSLQRIAAETWVREEYPPDAALAAIIKHGGKDRIHIGYFSADFREHPVSQLTAELFESHDRSRYELSAFSFGPDTRDEMTQRVERAFDRFVDIRSKSDHDAALLARSLDIDIAVDLGGFTQDARPRIFAARAAPLQVGYMGFPGTMGAPYMDYLVADRTLIPEHGQHHYREKIIYLPDSYLVNDSTRGISDTVFSRDGLGLPQTGFVFCCFNNSYKIAPATFDLWMRILKRVQGGVLWLSQTNPQATSNLRLEAARRDVDPRRLIFAERLSMPADHLARHRAADLFLDTLPYNAHTTASDALWAGLPVLTIAGETFSGRVAASLLRAIGLPELIAATQAEYEQWAVELAADPPRLALAKHKLAANRLATPLFDTRLFTRHLESAYTAIYERYQADLPCEHIHVQCS